MVTQAPATASACFQLAALAQKKRCLGTAPQSLGVYVRCRLRRPLWCQLTEWLRRRLTPLAFSSVGSAAVRSAQLRRSALHFGGVGCQTSLRSGRHPTPPAFRCSPPPLCFTLSAPPRSLEKAVSRHCYAEPRRFSAVSAAPSALVPTPCKMITASR